MVAAETSRKPRPMAESSAQPIPRGCHGRVGRASANPPDRTLQATLAIYAQQYVYDAWNRLVAVWVDSDDNESRAGDGSEDIATYQYDGLGRRIVRTDCTADPDVVYHDYYTPSWQLIEVRKGGKAYTDLHKQFVWGLRYIDAPILRDRETNAGSAGLDERLYYTQDGNFNVTALVNPAGDVVERYSYDAYGQVTVRNGAENVDPDTVNDPATEWDVDNASDVDNRILYCGYRFDPETGLYHVRHRYLHPTLGRWTTPDPLGYVDGMNGYEYCGGQPVGYVDIRALAKKPCIGLSTLKAYNKDHSRQIAEALEEQQARKKLLKKLWGEDYTEKKANREWKVWRLNDKVAEHTSTNAIMKV